MKIYGFTIVGSDGDILVSTETGKADWQESKTELFTSREECINRAQKLAETVFTEQEFEDDIDENERGLEEFLEDAKNFENFCIQDSCRHYTFEFFVKEMVDVINRNDFIATKLWSREDIKERLAYKHYRDTDENVDKIVATGYLKGLGERAANDWDIIDAAIYEALGR